MLIHLLPPVNNRQIIEYTMRSVLTTIGRRGYVLQGFNVEVLLLRRLPTSPLFNGRESV